MPYKISVQSVFFQLFFVCAPPTQPANSWRSTVFQCFWKYLCPAVEIHWIIRRYICCSQVNIGKVCKTVPFGFQPVLSGIQTHAQQKEDGFWKMSEWAWVEWSFSCITHHYRPQPLGQNCFCCLSGLAIVSMDSKR